jgi:Family of unknown function (DUF6496)
MAAPKKSTKPATRKKSAKKTTSKKATSKKATAKKPTAKKPTSRRTTAKKPASRRTTAKKPVSRRSTAKKSTTKRYGEAASDKVEKAMHERKRGTLRSGSGQKVTSKKQAIAIGLSQARKRGAKVPKQQES